MKAEARVRVEFPSVRAAQAAERALKGEEAHERRFSSSVSRSGKTVVAEVNGADVVAVRAAANAFLRYLQTFEGMEGENNG